MNPKIFLYAFGVWFIFVVFAIINGAVREKIYSAKVGELSGHQISSVIMICFIFLVVYIFLSSVKIEYGRGDLVFIGVFWVVLTVLFEFVFGHYVMGVPWEKLIGDYKIYEGRLWGLVLLATLVAPYLVWRFLKRI